LHKVWVSGDTNKNKLRELLEIRESLKHYNVAEMASVNVVKRFKDSIISSQAFAEKQWKVQRLKPKTTA